MASGRRRLLSAVLFVLLPASGFVLLASVFYTLVIPDTVSHDYWVTVTDTTAGLPAVRTTIAGPQWPRATRQPAGSPAENPVPPGEDPMPPRVEDPVPAVDVPVPAVEDPVQPRVEEPVPPVEKTSLDVTPKAPTAVLAVKAMTATSVPSPSPLPTLMAAVGEDGYRFALRTLSDAYMQLLGPTADHPVPTVNWPSPTAWARVVATFQRHYDDLSAPVVPLSPEEAALAPVRDIVPGSIGYFQVEEGVRAIATANSLKGALINRTAENLAALSAKYCGKCRRYFASVPNRGARLGHYMHNWMSAFTFAATTNLTLLYHPILPNQAERQLFDRFFGFGYDELFRLYEACTDGLVGFECNAFLPCLKLIDDPAKINRKAIADAAGECDVVYQMPGEQYPAGPMDPVVLHGILRKRYHRARRLNPLSLVYDPSHINIALHIRRGDVARDPEKHAGRLTSDVAYANAVMGIQKLVEGHPQFGPKLKGRIRVHVYSQGVKADFPALVPLEEQGLLQFHLDAPLLSTIFHLTMADIMLSAKSGFSYLAGVLRESWQLTLFPSTTFNNRVQGWVPFHGEDGSFEADPVAKMITVLLGSLYRREQIFALGTRLPLATATNVTSSGAATDTVSASP